MKVAEHQKKILVFGFFKPLQDRSRSNLGDTLFIDAFYALFPQYDFVFTETINEKNLIGIDAIFFGGGSFLGDKPRISPEALQLLLIKPLFYLGVGVEAYIDPIHLQLMAHARMIAIRSIEQLERVRLINSQTCFLPDLVYALQAEVKQSPKLNQSVLIMPNVSVLPQSSAAHWKHAAWTYFKSEFAQFIDCLIEKNYQPHFFSMCHAIKLEDDWAASELIGAMEKRNSQLLLSERPQDIEAITQLVSQYDLIITQRYHGIILAEMCKVPYIVISHHDKLKYAQGNGTFLSYYGISKDQLLKATEQTIKMTCPSSFSIDPIIFSAFSQEVISLMK